MKVRLLPVTALAFALCVAGCSSSGEQVDGNDRATDAFLTKDELRAEVVTESEKLTLPEGFVWPDHALDNYPDDGMFEPGYGVGIALEVAFCAWQREAFTLRETDPEASARAIDEFEKLTQSETVSREYDPASVDIFRDQVGSVRLGDWSHMQYEVEVLCEFYLAEDPSKATKVKDLLEQGDL